MSSPTQTIDRRLREEAHRKLTVKLDIAFKNLMARLDGINFSTVKVSGLPLKDGEPSPTFGYVLKLARDAAHSALIEQWFDNEIRQFMAKVDAIDEGWKEIAEIRDGGRDQ